MLQAVEQGGGAADVDVDVVLDAVEGLSDADGGGRVHDRIGIRHGALHEPAHFVRCAKVLLPKDWLRWRMTGAFFSDMSDAAGTLWMDVGARAWSQALRELLGPRPFPLKPRPTASCFPC